MTKIAVIGAGGFEFPLTLTTDFLSFESMRAATIALMDIDEATLARTDGLVRRVVEAHGLPATIESTTDRRAALSGADFVVVCFQVGGVEAYLLDIEIPQRYGIDQTVGDTLGPGGVFRGLRSLVALDEIVRDMHELCPDALILQYANPMAINCWYTSGEGIETVGLCHSVQHTAELLSQITGSVPGTWSFKAAGINHQTWMLEWQIDGRDGLDELRTAVNEYARGEREAVGEIDEWYGGGREQVRTAIMNLTGYFPTESSHHASEYLPYFRRTKEEAESYIARRWDYLDITGAHDERELERTADELAQSELEASEEYAALIIDSVLTGTPRVVYGNVPNTGLVTNLPAGCCVEVPCLVDRSGVQPTYVGDLPAACAAVNLGSIAVQSCAVEAFRQRSRELVHAAVALDRLTSAVLSLDEIRRMTDELLAAEAQWLPELA